MTIFAAPPLDAGIGAPPLTPEQIEQELGGSELPVVDHIGVGFTVIDGQSVAVVVYHNADPQVSEANVGRVRSVLEMGRLRRTGQPLTEVLGLRSVELVDGVVVATMTIDHPGDVRQMFGSRELPFLTG